MMGTFDQRVIEWNGESLACRPVEWDGEVTDENTKPTKYECSCPACGHLVRFDASVDKVSCENCSSWAVLSALSSAIESELEEKELDQEPEPEVECEPEPELEHQEVEPEPEPDEEPEVEPEDKATPQPPANTGGFVVEENPLAGLKIDTRSSQPKTVVTSPKASLKPKSIETKKNAPQAAPAQAPKSDKLRSVQKTDVDKLLQKLKKR